MAQQKSTIGRRTVLKTGAAFAAASPFILRLAEAQGKVLYVNTWGGVWTTSEDEAYYKPFTKETGIEIVPVTPVAYAKLKAQVQSGNYEWDCSTLNASELFQAEKENLLEPIDWTVVHRENIPPDSILKNIAIGTSMLSTNLTWRKEKFPNGGPKTWADFWNVEKFPGNRAGYDRPFTMLAFALLADGVPRDKVYPLDLDRAFKKLDEIKPHIKVWYTQGTQQQQLIRDGEVDLLPMWNARAIELIHQGVPIVMEWDGAEDGGIHWHVPRGTPRAKLAWQFAEFCTRADRVADFCTRMSYGPENPKAFDFMSKQAVEESPTLPAHLATSFLPDAEWLAPRLGNIRERWSQWLAG